MREDDDGALDAWMRLAAAVFRRAALDAAGHCTPLENRCDTTWAERVAELQAEAADFLAADSPRLQEWADALDVEGEVLHATLARMPLWAADETGRQRQKREQRAAWRRGEAGRRRATLTA